MITKCKIDFLQEAINLIYIPYTWRNAWKVIFHFSIVDDDVVRFVWDLPERRWLYRYHYMGKLLMMYDRFSDIEHAVLFSMYCFHLFPHWEVCLGIYAILRLISFMVYSNTKMYKCYAVRTVLPTIISGLFCSAVAWVPCIIAWNNDPLVLLPICECLAWSAGYLVALVVAYRKLWIVDLDVLFELRDDRWVYRYYSYKRFLMINDRLYDILVVGLFTFYILESVPHSPLCLIICIFSRLISFALYSNTKIRKCYAVRTVLPAILSLLCMITLWAPFIIAWINDTFVILPFFIFLVMSLVYVIHFLAICNKNR